MPEARLGARNVPGGRMSFCAGFDSRLLRLILREPTGDDSEGLGLVEQFVLDQESGLVRLQGVDLPLVFTRHI